MSRTALHAMDRSARDATVPYFDGVMFHERRAVPRRPVTGHATGVASDPSDPTRPKRICTLTLLNRSERGLGAISGAPLPVGGRVALCLPPHGSEPASELRGTITRCRQRSGGYEIGVALSIPRRAA